MNNAANPGSERQGSAPRNSPLSLALIAILSLGLGYVVFKIVQWLVTSLWTDVPANTFDGSAPWYYLLALPMVAGVLVALFRRGADGHNPLGGISAAPISVPDYPFVLAAILATLAGGLVLGPEVALVSTGSVIGGFIGSKQPNPDMGKAVGVGVIFGLLALVVDPIRTGTLSVGDGGSFAWDGLWHGAIAAIATAILLGVIFALGKALVAARGGDRPVVWQLALAGLAVGGVAWCYQTWADQPVDLVLTSGEQMIRPMMELGSIGLILATVAAKSLAYWISLGSGFRGGPYFPAMFAGAGFGAVTALIFDAPTQGPALAGLLAAMAYLAKTKWVFTVVLALALGFILGGLALIPVALLGAAIGKLIPRFTAPVPLQDPAPEPERAATA
ncbi:MAG: chloride channel protein [Actinomycetia bacterium]|nr:chloride channel protein [Actinomycetes bacterium]